MSKSGGIEILSASAGTGKTHELTQTLAGLLADGASRVRSEGVMATTFTRKAAAELAERARQVLMAVGRRSEAWRLGDGLIGTVNSVCGRLLERFAFEAGLSPQLRVLDENEAKRAFEVALADVLSARDVERLYRLAAAFGADGGAWRDDVRRIVQAARANGMSASDLSASGRRSVSTMLVLLPPAVPGDGSNLDRNLKKAIDQAVKDVAAADDGTGKTRKCIDALKAAAAEWRSDGRVSWSTWLRLTKLDPGKACSDAVRPVCEAAARHLEHPGLRRDLEAWVTGVFDLAARSLTAFQEWKTGRRLLDFTDQEARVLGLLDRPEVRTRLAEDLDVLLVDEFQDTSPIQLALFLRLARLARRSTWVGDPKQSIFGFRDADPELMQAMLEKLPPHRILEDNHRSRPALVDLTSELFAHAFEPAIPEQQVRSKPVRGDDPALPVPLQFWSLCAPDDAAAKAAAGGTAAASGGKGGRKGKVAATPAVPPGPALRPVKNDGEEAAAIAVGIARLLGEPGAERIRIVDRQEGGGRTIRPGDVAVLCRRNDACRRIAAALERLGIRAAVARQGLLDTPEAVLALAGLHRVLDRFDTLATAEIVALTADDPAPETWLADRLRFLAAGGASEAWAADHPVLQALDSLRDAVPQLSPTEVMDAVIDRAGLRRRVLAWGRAAVRLGNLEALRRLASLYEDECRKEGAAASLPGLASWLAGTPAAELDKQAEGTGPDAVQISTYHAAKGLEWPVVVLTDLGDDPRGDPWGLSVQARAGAFDAEAPLADRWLRYWQWPFGSFKRHDELDQREEVKAAERRALDRDAAEALRLLYVGMTRARDVLVLTARPVKSGGHKHAWLDLLTGARAGDGRFFPEVSGRQVFAVPGSSLTLDAEVVTCVAPAAGPAPVAGGAGTGSAAGAGSWANRAAPVAEVWVPAEPGPGAFPPATVAASSGLPVPPGGARVARTVEVGPRLAVAGRPDMAELGDAVHAFLAADDPGRARAAREAMARDLLARHGVVGKLEPGPLVDGADAFRAKIAGLYRVLAWRPEWPLAVRVDGQVIAGWADLVLEVEGGLVVVDHKSFPGDRKEWPARALGHAGQLAAYARALGTATDRPVLATWIHYPIGGGLVEVALGQA